MSATNPATGGDSGERLAAFVAPQIVAEDLPALFPLLAAQPLLSAFSALFHGSEAAVQIRLLVLRDTALPPRLRELAETLAITGQKGEQEGYL